MTADNADKPNTEKVHVKLTLNADGVIAPALRAMRLSSEMMAIALDALEHADLANPPPVEGAFFTLGFSNAEDTAVKKAAYSAWLLGKGFQELAKGVRETLEEAYLYVMIMREHPNLQIYGDLMQAIDTIKRKANKFKFPDLSKAIQDELGQELDFADEFRSMQRVRNCLEHRDGVVGQIDLDPDGQTLRLRLPRLKFFIEDDGRETEVVKNQHIEKGTEIGMRRDIRVREYALGTRITFSPAEFQEIAYACWFFANDLGRKLPKIEPRNDAPAPQSAPPSPLRVG